MSKTCIIVDDELTARKILKKYIQNVSTLELVGEYKNAIEVLEFLEKQKVDLIFLDIEMPKLSGINFAKIIEGKSKIIFTTAHREFALEGFELNAVDYLLKPFSFDRFLKAVQRITIQTHDANAAAENDYIYVKANKKMHKVNFESLQYIEGLGNYIKLHTDSDVLVIYDKLSSIFETLPKEFMRIHKSYIINTSKITLYTRDYVKLNNKQIPISSTYRKSLIQFLK